MGSLSGGGELICRGSLYFFQMPKAGEQTKAGGASPLAGGPAPVGPPRRYGAEGETLSI